MGVATGVFQYTNGSPVANATYQWKLSQDAIEVNLACVAPTIINGSLDASGNLTTTFAFNDVLSTTGGATTFYQLTVKAQNGGQVWNENYYLTGTAANLNTIPPGGQGSIVTTPISNILLQTNGVTNSIQTLENLVAGTNVTLSYSAGSTTINSSAGGGSGPTFSAAGGPAFISTGIPTNGPTHAFAVQNGMSQIAKITNAANEIRVWQFALYVNYVIGHASIFQFSSAAGTSSATCSWGIYDSAGATKLVDSGTFAVATPGSGVPQTHNLSSVTLTAGTYLFAQTATNTTTSGGLIGWAASGATLPTAYTAFINTFPSTPRISVAASTSAAGVLPSSLGVLTAATATSTALPDIAAVLFEP